MQPNKRNSAFGNAKCASWKEQHLQRMRGKLRYMEMNGVAACVSMSHGWRPTLDNIGQQALSSSQIIACSDYYKPCRSNYKFPVSSRPAAPRSFVECEDPSLWQLPHVTRHTRQKSSRKVDRSNVHRFYCIRVIEPGFNLRAIPKQCTPFLTALDLFSHRGFA